MSAFNIFRDLKVENLLLNERKDVKIIGEFDLNRTVLITVTTIKRK